MELKVSTTDFLVIRKFEKTEIKFHYLNGKGKSFFFLRGFREFEGLINH